MEKVLKRIFHKISLIISYLHGNSRLELIYYHDVVSEKGSSYMQISTKKFYKQMEYLKDSGYNTLNYNDLEDESWGYNNEDKNVLITFDDGWISNYEVVYPIMKKLNLKFNIFLEVGAIDHKENHLTWDMINLMKESNLVSFGAHTYNHIDARTIDKNNLDIEIIMANNLIEEKTGLIVKDFCFPYGYYNENTISYLDDIGVYKRLYTSDGIPMIIRNNIMVFGRVGIENEDSMKDFINKLEGRYNLYYSITNKIKKSIKGEK